MTLSCALCRTAGTPGDVALDLGDQPSIRHYPAPSDPLPDPTYPLAMWVCPSCGLAQLVADDTDGPEVQVHESTAVVDQARQSVEDLGDLLAGRSTVRAFPSPHGGSGIDEYVARGLSVATGQADVVVDSFGIMHEPDQARAVAERAAAVAPGGMLVFTVQALGDIVAGRQWTALRHGHVAYYSLTSLRNALASVGFVPTSLRRYALYGGTVVVVATRDGAPDESLTRVYEREAEAGLASPTGFGPLRASVATGVEDLRAYLDGHAAKGSRLYAYGAPSRAISLLAAVGSSARALTAVADAAPAKQGRCLPMSRVPVISPVELVAADPDEVLLLLDDLYDEVLAAHPTLAGRLVRLPGGADA